MSSLAVGNERKRIEQTPVVEEIERSLSRDSLKRIQRNQLCIQKKGANSQILNLNQCTD